MVILTGTPPSKFIRPLYSDWSVIVFNPINSPPPLYQISTSILWVGIHPLIAYCFISVSVIKYRDNGSEGILKSIFVCLLIVYKWLNGLSLTSTKTSLNLLETNGINDFSLKKQNNNGILRVNSSIE